MSKLDDYRLRNSNLNVALDRLRAELATVKSLPEHYAVDELKREAYFAGLVRAQTLMVDVLTEDFPERVLE